MDGDIFTENPLKTLQNIENFLGLPSFFTSEHFDFSGRKGFPCFKLDPESASRCMGVKKGRDHPEINKENLRFLRNYFKPILRKFKLLSGMKLRLS